jgi:pyrimidine operon attenuation protein/uracil phosphoribosyltransferase
MAEPAGNIPDTIEQMARDLAALLEEQSIENPVMVGIHTGGVWIAEQLHNKLNIVEPLGNLDISFYRDDFTRIGMNPQVRPSKLPFSIDNQHIILIDDVLHTGRTIRAALNELFDYGRPASIMLAVLVERGGRELPIEANVVGCRMTLSRKEQVKLIGPDPLSLEIQQSP